MKQATQQAIKHLVIVFFYSGASSILPIVLVWIEKEPRWALLIPIINSVWYSVVRYLKRN